MDLVYGQRLNVVEYFQIHSFLIHKDLETSIKTKVNIIEIIDQTEITYRNKDNNPDKNNLNILNNFLNKFDSSEYYRIYNQISVYISILSMHKLLNHIWHYLNHYFCKNCQLVIIFETKKTMKRSRI